MQAGTAIMMGRTRNDVGILVWKLFRGRPFGRPGMGCYGQTRTMLGWEVNEADCDTV